jgi:hypothetical protein
MDLIGEMRTANIGLTPAPLERLLVFARRRRDAELALHVYEEVQAIFKELPKMIDPNDKSDSYRAKALLVELLRCFAWLRRPTKIRDTIRLLDDAGVPITAYHMNYLLGAFAKPAIRHGRQAAEGVVDQAIRVFASMQRTGRADNASYALMLRMYSAIGDEAGFEQVLQQRRTSLTTLERAAVIQAYCNLGKTEQAWEYFMVDGNPISIPDATPFPALASLYLAYHILAQQLADKQMIEQYLEVNKEIELIKRKRDNMDALIPQKLRSKASQRTGGPAVSPDDLIIDEP